jgi:tetratricopeptide (TPR) repeat protein
MPDHATHVTRMTVLRVLRHTPFLLTGVVWLIAAIVSTQFPLLHVLGYEFSLLMSLCVAWVGTPALLYMSRRFMRLPAISPMRDVMREWLLLSGAMYLLLLPPVAVMTVNALFVRNCAPLEGALLYILLPGLTLPFVVALAILLRGLFPKRAGIAAIVLYMLLQLQPLIEILARPQLYAYNHVFGMFIGLTWDQQQPPLETLATYRILTLLYVVLLLVVAAAVRSLRSRGCLDASVRRSGVVFFSALLLAAGMTLYGDVLGFSNSMANIRRHMPAHYTTPSFTLMYDSAVVSDEEIRWIAEEHEFRLQEVVEELDVTWTRHIISVLYTDREMRSRLLGTRGSEVARPWKAEIHLSRESWSASLKHELVHVVAREFGPNYIGVPFLRVLGLTEGLAMAIEWDYGNRTLHEYAAAMRHYGYLPSVKRFMSTLGFMTGASSVGYVAGGSFTRWLLAEYGLDALKQAYSSDDIEGVYGRDFAELERGWHGFLEGVQRKDSDSLATAWLFRRQSLFTALCPRVIGKRTREAAALLREGDAGKALRDYEQLERLAPGPAPAFGKVQALYQLEKMDSVIAYTKRLLADSGRAWSVLPVLLWQGAAAWGKGDSAMSDKSWTALIEADLPGWTTDRARRLRLLLREHAFDTELRDIMLASLRMYSNADSVRHAMAGAVLRLTGRRPCSHSLYREALERMAAEEPYRDSALTILTSIPEAKRDARMWQLMGMLLYRRDRAPEARECFRRAASNDAAAGRDIETWLRRCDWKERVLLEPQDFQRVETRTHTFD